MIQNPRHQHIIDALLADKAAGRLPTWDAAQAALARAVAGLPAIERSLIVDVFSRAARYGDRGPKAPTFRTAEEAATYEAMRRMSDSEFDNLSAETRLHWVQLSGSNARPSAFHDPDEANTVRVTSRQKLRDSEAVLEQQFRDSNERVVGLTGEARVDELRRGTALHSQLIALRVALSSVDNDDE